MPQIKVKKLDETTFEVTVLDRTTTIHQVSVALDYANRLTGGKFPAEHLVSCSFAFLLEREPNTSILRSFDLPIISRYFPEYEQVIRKTLG